MEDEGLWDSLTELMKQPGGAPKTNPFEALGHQHGPVTEDFELVLFGNGPLFDVLMLPLAEVLVKYVPGVEPSGEGLTVEMSEITADDPTRICRFRRARPEDLKHPGLLKKSQ